MVRIELNIMSDGAYDSFVNEELDQFVSFAIRQFYARRLSGFTPDRTSFEEGQKRSDDMKYVYAYEDIAPSYTGTRNGSKFTSFKLPSNYWHMMSEDAEITSQTAFPDDEDYARQFDVYECTTDNLTERLRNSLSSHIYDKGTIRPLRLYNSKESPSGDTTFSLATLYYKGPSDMYISKYSIEYIKKPQGFGLYSPGYSKASFNEDKEINQVPDHAWDEVMAITTRHALENTSSYRNQSYQAETALVQ